MWDLSGRAGGSDQMTISSDNAPRGGVRRSLVKQQFDGAG
jgi:hypothetical protein